MSRRLSYLFAVLAGFSLLLSCKGEKIIPKKDMTAIVVDMYMADQWVRETSKRQKIADTSYVYNPIFAKYGYTADDYRRSMDYYTNTPGDFSTVYRDAAKILDRRRKELDLMERGEFIRDSIARARAQLPYRHADFTELPDMSFYVSGMFMVMDSTLLWRFNPIGANGDTLLIFKPGDISFSLFNFPLDSLSRSLKDDAVNVEVDDLIIDKEYDSKLKLRRREPPMLEPTNISTEEVLVEADFFESE